MIFRRTNDITPNKNVMSSNQRSTGNTAPRLETPAYPAAPTPNTNVTQPLSPIAMAQSRRTTNAQPAGFNRQEQLRKLTVGRDISLNGEITTCDHLIVEGNIVATIKDGQVLEISETGTFSGLVEIETADIAGRFDGNLTVRGKLVIRATAVVTGSIQYGRLQIDTGAILDGQIKPLPEAVQQALPEQPLFQQQTQKQDNGVYSLASVNDQPGFLKASA